MDEDTTVAVDETQVSDATETDTQPEETTEETTAVETTEKSVPYARFATVAKERTALKAERAAWAQEKARYEEVLRNVAEHFKRQQKPAEEPEPEDDDPTTKELKDLRGQTVAIREMLVAQKQAELEKQLAGTLKANPGAQRDEVVKLAVAGYSFEDAAEISAARAEVRARKTAAATQAVRAKAPPPPLPGTGSAKPKQRTMSEIINGL